MVKLVAKQGFLEKPTNGLMEVPKEDAREGLEEEGDDNINEDDEAESVAISLYGSVLRAIEADKMELGM